MSRNFASPTNAQNAGEYMGQRAARIWFNSRGNHSETHLSEGELGAIIAKAVEIAMTDPKGLISKARIADMVASQRAAQGWPQSADERGRAALRGTPVTL
jgi:hypothetical protein